MFYLAYFRQLILHMYFQINFNVIVYILIAYFRINEVMSKKNCQFFGGHTRSVFKLSGLMFMFTN